MSIYINIRTGEYPRHIGDIQLAAPDWNNDTDNLPDGWYAVTETPRPELAANQITAEGVPELVDGQYVQTWVVTTLTNAELEERRLAAARARLAATGLTVDDLKSLLG